MNNELPPLELRKSAWGIFYLDRPVILDSEYCNKIIKPELKNIPATIQQELYKNAVALTVDWQEKFHWEQSKMKHNILIADPKHKLSLSILPKLLWTQANTQSAKKWIQEWNKSTVADRLVNYSSVPVFSNDGKYVLIFRGQHVTSEGWDTIYIYKKENNEWIIMEKIIVREI